MRTHGLRKLYWLVEVATITVVALIAYGQGMYETTLFGDDWGHTVRQALDGESACPSNAGLFLRPLDLCWFSLQYRLFGLDVRAFHVLKVLLTVVVALLLFALLKRIFASWGPFSLVCTLIFLVYPSHLSSNWLVAVQPDSAYAFLLLGFLVLVEYYRRGSNYLILISAALVILSLETYEAGLGVLYFGALCAFIWEFRNKKLKRPASVVLGAVALAFTIGRWIEQRQSGANTFGHDLGTLAVTPSAIASRLAMAYRINLSWAWKSALHQALSGLNLNESHAHLRSMLPFVLTIIVIIGISVALLTRLASRTLSLKVSTSSTESESPSSLQLVGVACIGLVGIGAGSVPMIAAVIPNLNFADSRENVLPSIAASLVITTLLASVCRLFRRIPYLPIAIWVLTTAPLVFLGIATQHATSNASLQDWSQQEIIWHEMFQLVPDFAPNTTVLLIVDQPMSVSGPSPFSASPWGFTAALATLYGHKDIQGYFTYRDNQAFEFRPSGVIYRPLGIVIPYSRAVLLRYDPVTKQLTQEPNTSTLDGAAKLNEEFCRSCILDHLQPGREIANRLLVATTKDQKVLSFEIGQCRQNQCN